MLSYIIITIFVIYVLSFTLKNIVTRIREKQSIKSKSPLVFLIVLFSVLLHLIILIELFWPEYNCLFLKLTFFDQTILKWIGVSLLIISQIIGVAALFTMGNSWRVGVLEDQKTALVTQGIFSLSRNPYFLSLLLMYSGYLMIFTSLLLIIISAVLAMIINRLIKAEEKYLESKHSKEYLEYRKRVRRYL